MVAPVVTAAGAGDGGGAVTSLRVTVTAAASLYI